MRWWCAVMYPPSIISIHQVLYIILFCFEIPWSVFRARTAEGYQHPAADSGDVGFLSDQRRQNAEECGRGKFLFGQWDVHGKTFFSPLISKWLWIEEEQITLGIYTNKPQIIYVTINSRICVWIANTTEICKVHAEILKRAVARTWFYLFVCN